VKNASALGISFLNGITTTTANFLQREFFHRQTGCLIKCTRNLGLINLSHKYLIILLKTLQHPTKIMIPSQKTKKNKPPATPKWLSTKNRHTLRKLSWSNLKKNQQIPQKFNPNLNFLKILRQITPK
jgi:hypothetical protein